MSDPIREQPAESLDEPFPIGSTIGGRYVLRRVLGRGGAAVVFAAEHSVVKRYVALKLPLPDDDLREVLGARLRRETQALARVRHPVVVDVIDAGDSGGTPFLAMQMLEGRTLSGLVAARTRLEADEVVKIGVELASGLSAIHAAGILHRDVKPGNVIVTRDVGNQIRLFDFGVAKLTGTADIVDSKLTQSGAILGTVEYMAPEALLSLAGADHRGDMYALGVTLYECMTGAVPFDGGLGQVLLKVSTMDPPDLATVRPDLPRALTDVVHRCLKRDPNERYASMAEVAVALAGCTEKRLDAIDLLGTQTRTRAQPPPLPPRQNAQIASPAAPSAVAAPAAIPRPEARRVLPRAPYVTMASILRERQHPVDARIEDISEGGVLVVVSEQCTPGDIVRLRFALPVSGRITETAAIIRWSRSTRGTRATGFEFKALPEAALAEVRQYVKLMGGE